MTTGNDWVDQARRLFDALRAGTGEPGGEAAGQPVTHGPDCRWCPICQAAGVLRGERPELTAALADVLTATAAALRSFAGEPGSPGAPTDEADLPDEEPPPAVQRIELA
jgi:hypothetical protein